MRDLGSIQWNVPLINIRKIHHKLSLAHIYHYRILILQLLSSLFFILVSTFIDSSRICAF